MVDLNRQFGQPQPPAQRAAGKTAAARLFGGDPLEKGELSGLLRDKPQSAAAILSRPDLCLDCEEAVVNPLRSQPRRCRACGQAKRQAHNQAARERREQLLEQLAG